jgi:hypothetical protein
MARAPNRVSPYDLWLKGIRDAHSEAAGEVSRLEREIAARTAELDGLFADLAEQTAIRDHSGHTIELNSNQYREKASRPARIERAKKDGE